LLVILKAIQEFLTLILHIKGKTIQTISI